MGSEDSSGAKGCTILVVEDDGLLRLLVSELLRDEGYSVLEAADGADAIDMLGRSGESRSIALVILDMNLPRVDGLGVLQHIAERGTFVPVVAMSALAPNLAAAKVRGAREVLLKPFEVERLLEVVARICPPQSG